MRRPVKKPLREQLAGHLAAEHYMAAMTGKPIRDNASSILDGMGAQRVRSKSTLPTESQEQRAFVKWFRMQYPSVRIFAIPNGGNRDAITGAIMRSEGVCAGVPDLFVPAWRLWIEFKRIKGSATSDEQKDWCAYLTQRGYSHFYAFGCEDGIKKVKDFYETLTKL